MKEVTTLQALVIINLTNNLQSDQVLNFLPIVLIITKTDQFNLVHIFNFTEVL